MKKSLQWLRYQIRLKEAYRNVFEGTGEDGKIVLRHLAQQSGITKPKLSLSDERLRENVGERRIVWSILRFLKKPDEDLYNELDRQALLQDREPHEEITL
jgi:hypothetical protein